MGMIKVKHKGNFKNTERFFDRSLKHEWYEILSAYAQEGTQLLQRATPSESGETAESWDYTIEKGNGNVTIAWTNSHENQGVNIAILIIYGHGLWNGGYVQGNDFVTPTMIPLMQELANRVWEEVTK